MSSESQRFVAFGLMIRDSGKKWARPRAKMGGALFRENHGGRL